MVWLQKLGKVVYVAIGPLPLPPVTNVSLLLGQGLKPSSKPATSNIMIAAARSKIGVTNIILSQEHCIVMAAAPSFTSGSKSARFLCAFWQPGPEFAWPRRCYSSALRRRAWTLQTGWACDSQLPVCRRTHTCLPPKAAAAMASAAGGGGRGVRHSSRSHWLLCTFSYRKVVVQFKQAGPSCVSSCIRDHKAAKATGVMVRRSTSLDRVTCDM